MTNPRARSFKNTINIHKYRRVANDPLSKKVKVLYLINRDKSKNFTFRASVPVKAIEAYQLGDYIYVWRKCDTPEGRNVKTQFVRYNLNKIKTRLEVCYVGRD